VKLFTCRYGPVDCTQAVRGRGWPLAKVWKVPIRIQVGCLSVSGSPFIFYGPQFQRLMQLEQVSIVWHGVVTPIYAVVTILTLYTKEGWSHYAFFHILSGQGQNVRVVKRLMQCSQAVKSLFAMQSNGHAEALMVKTFDRW